MADGIDSDPTEDGWISELRDWLGRNAQPFTLASSDFLTLLEEIQLLDDDPDAAAWKALHHELSNARALLGPEALRALDGPVAKLLQDARALDTKSAKSVAAVRKDTGKLIAALNTEEVASCVWNDLIAAVKDRHLDTGVVQWRRDLVAHLARQRGRDWEEQSNLAKGVLADRAWDIWIAHAVLDHPSPESFDSTEPDARAGLSAEQRCALAEKIIDTPPRVGRHIVWVAFERAQLHQFPSISIGSVTFYDAGRIRDILEHEARGDDRLPVELHSRWVSFANIPDIPQLILARIDLGTGRFTNPVAQATEQAQALVRLACFRANVYRFRVWRLLHGSIHAVDDEIVSQTVFRTESEDEPWNEIFSAPSYGLAELGRDIADKDLSPSARVLSSGLAWLQHSTVLEPSIGLLLAVRVIEMLSQEAHIDSWSVYLDRYYSAAWIRHQVKSTLGRSVRQAVGIRHSITGRVGAAQRQPLDEIASKVVHYDRTGQYRVDLGNAYDHLSALIDIHGSDSVLSRQLRDIRAKLSSIEALAGWCSHLRREWVLQTGRLRRARNAIAHGQGAPLRVVDAAAPFAIQLAAWALEESTTGTLTEVRLRALVEQLRGDAEGWLRDLRKFRDVRTALTDA